MPQVEAQRPAVQAGTALLRFFARRSKTFILAVGFAFIALLGVVDYSTGYQVSFAVFYLLPVVFVPLRPPLHGRLPRR